MFVCWSPPLIVHSSSILCSFYYTILAHKVGEIVFDPYWRCHSTIKTTTTKQNKLDLNLCRLTRQWIEIAEKFSRLWKDRERESESCRCLGFQHSMTEQNNLISTGKRSYAALNVEPTIHKHDSSMCVVEQCIALVVAIRNGLLLD